jgi:hypothetical protein
VKIVKHPGDRVGRAGFAAGAQHPRDFRTGSMNMNATARFRLLTGSISSSARPMRWTRIVSMPPIRFQAAIKLILNNHSAST